MKRKEFMKYSVLLGSGFLIPLYNPKPTKRKLKKLHSFEPIKEEYRLMYAREGKGFPDITEYYENKNNPRLEVTRHVFKDKKNLRKLEKGIAKSLKEGKLTFKEMIIDEEVFNNTPPGEVWPDRQTKGRRFIITVR